MNTTTTQTVTRVEHHWPQRLDQATDPNTLYVRGNLDVLARWNTATCLTGARACTQYGAQVAHMLAEHIATTGGTLLTGLSYGIDGDAVRASLAARNPNIIAILPGGLDRPYPAGNADLAHAVLEAGGVLVSAEPDATSPTRERFHTASLLRATAGRVVIIEAASRSGALTVAQQAHHRHVPVFAVPGPITSMSSLGTNRLLTLPHVRTITGPADLT